jgi:hypothetical protein
MGHFRDKYSDDEILKAAKIVEAVMRRISRNCGIITMDDGDTQLDDASWSGCITEGTLGEALLTGLKETEDDQ